MFHKNVIISCLELQEISLLSGKHNYGLPLNQKRYKYLSNWITNNISYLGKVFIHLFVFFLLLCNRCGDISMIFDGKWAILQN